MVESKVPLKSGMLDYSVFNSMHGFYDHILKKFRFSERSVHFALFYRLYPVQDYAIVIKNTLFRHPIYQFQPIVRIDWFSSAPIYTRHRHPAQLRDRQEWIAVQQYLSRINRELPKVDTALSSPRSYRTDLTDWDIGTGLGLVQHSTKFSHRFSSMATVSAQLLASSSQSPVHVMEKEYERRSRELEQASNRRDRFEAQQQLSRIERELIKVKIDYMLHRSNKIYPYPIHRDAGTGWGSVQLATKYTRRFSSIATINAQLLASSIQPAVHNFEKEYKKHSRELVQSRTRRERIAHQQRLSRIERELIKVRIDYMLHRSNKIYPYPIHRDAGTGWDSVQLATKYTRRFSSIATINAQLLASFIQPVVHNIEKEYKKHSRELEQSRTRRERIAHQQRLSRIERELIKMDTDYRSAGYYRNDPTNGDTETGWESSRLATKFIRRFSSLVVISSQLLESSSQSVVDSKKKEYEQRIQEVINSQTHNERITAWQRLSRVERELTKAAAMFGVDRSLMSSLMSETVDQTNLPWKSGLERTIPGISLLELSGMETPRKSGGLNYLNRERMTVTSPDLSTKFTHQFSAVLQIVGGMMESASQFALRTLEAEYEREYELHLQQTRIQQQSTSPDEPSTVTLTESDIKTRIPPAEPTVTELTGAARLTGFFTSMTRRVVQWFKGGSNADAKTIEKVPPGKTVKETVPGTAVRKTGRVEKRTESSAISAVAYTINSSYSSHISSVYPRDTRGRLWAVPFIRWKVGNLSAEPLVAMFTRHFLSVPRITEHLMKSSTEFAVHVHEQEYWSGEYIQLLDRNRLREWELENQDFYFIYAMEGKQGPKPKPLHKAHMSVDRLKTGAVSEKFTGIYNALSRLTTGLLHSSVSHVASNYEALFRQPLTGELKRLAVTRYRHLVLPDQQVFYKTAGGELPALYPVPGKPLTKYTAHFRSLLRYYSFFASSFAPGGPHRKKASGEYRILNKEYETMNFIFNDRTYADIRDSLLDRRYSVEAVPPGFLEKSTYSDGSRYIGVLPGGLNMLLDAKGVKINGKKTNEDYSLSPPDSFHLSELSKYSQSSILPHDSYSSYLSYFSRFRWSLGILAMEFQKNALIGMSDVQYSAFSRAMLIRYTGQYTGWTQRLPINALVSSLSDRRHMLHARTDRSNDFKTMLSRLVDLSQLRVQSHAVTETHQGALDYFTTAGSTHAVGGVYKTFQFSNSLGTTAKNFSTSLTAVVRALESTYLAYFSNYSRSPSFAAYTYWTRQRWQKYFASKHSTAVAHSTVSRIKSDVFKGLAQGFSNVYQVGDSVAPSEFLPPPVEQTLRSSPDGKGEVRVKDGAPAFPRLDRDRLSEHYTSRLFTGPPGPRHIPLALKETQFTHTAHALKSWAGPVSESGSLRTMTEKTLTPVEQLFKDSRAAAAESGSTNATDPRTVDLAELGQDLTHTQNRAPAFPGMTHFTQGSVQISTEVIKKIEKQVTQESQKFKSLVSSSTSSGSGARPDVTLNQMADNVYRLILDKVKKEKKMRGL